MPCKFEDDDGDWSGDIMIIMRGNSDPSGKLKYKDENGNPAKWEKGALHVQPAKDYAILMGFKPKVLAARGDNTDSDHNRAKSEGTQMALECFRLHNSITAFYGFSGGGFNLWHILHLMSKAERNRVKLAAVVGVDVTGKWATSESDYRFEGGPQVVDFMGNSPDIDHMFLPEEFLKRAKKRKP
jgi:hypothetical protein